MSAFSAPRATARQWCSIASIVTGSVVSWPSTTSANVSPTSNTGMPASSRILAVG